MLVLIAFFALPAVSLGFLGSLTGAQLTSLSAELPSDGSGPTWIVAFWLIPVLALATIGASAWLISSTSAASGARKTAAVGMAAYGIAAGIFLLIGLLSLTEEGLGFAISGGAWLMLLGLIAIAIGGILEHRNASPR